VVVTGADMRISFSSCSHIGKLFVFVFSTVVEPAHDVVHHIIL